MNPYWWNGMFPNYFGPQYFNPFSFPPPETHTLNLSTNAVASAEPTKSCCATKEIIKCGKPTDADVPIQSKHGGHLTERRRKFDARKLTENLKPESMKFAKRKPVPEGMASRVVAPQLNEHNKKRIRRKAKADTKPPTTKNARTWETNITPKRLQNRAVESAQSFQSRAEGEGQQQNDQLAVAVMAIAMALQPAQLSATIAAPDGIELD